MKHAKKWLSLILAFIMTAGTPLSALAAWEDGFVIPGQSGGSSGYDDLFWEYTDDGITIDSSNITSDGDEDDEDELVGEEETEESEDDTDVTYEEVSSPVSTFSLRSAYTATPLLADNYTEIYGTDSMPKARSATGSGPYDYLQANGGYVTVTADRALNNILHYDGKIVDNIHIAKWVADDPSALEYPAYCKNPGWKGTAQHTDGEYQIDPLESISTEEKKILGVARAGYPYKTPAELGCNSVDEAYYATHAAIHTAIIGGSLDKWSIQSGDTARNTRVLNALKQIYNEGIANPYTPPAVTVQLSPVSGSEEATVEGDWVVNTYQFDASIDRNTWKFRILGDDVMAMVENGTIEVYAGDTKIMSETNVSGAWDTAKAFKVDMGDDITVKVPKSLADSTGINFTLYDTSVGGDLETAATYLGDPVDLSGNWQGYIYNFRPQGTDSAVMTYNSSTAIPDTPDEDDPDDPDTPTSSNDGSLVVEKLDYNTKKKVEDAVFHIRGLNDSNNHINIAVKATNGATEPVLGRGTDIQISDGVIKLTGIPADVYEVTEVSSPPHYSVAVGQNSQSILVEDDAKVHPKVIFENKPYGSLTIRKVDAHTQDELAGFYFKVTNHTTGFETTVETGSNGEVTIVNLVADEDFTAVFENTEKATLTVHKVDSVTKDPLKNAKFEVYRAVNGSLDGEVVKVGEYTTNTNGDFVVDHAETGWHRIIEKQAPAGYERKIESVDVFLKAGEDKEITFENSPQSAIIIRKVDAETGEALEGIKFEMRYLSGATGTEGTVVGTYSTSKNGTITVAGLKPGVYSVAEVASDSDHILDDTLKTVTLKDDNSVVTVEFTNAPLGGLLIKKMDAVTKEPLSDVIFKVTDIKGAVVGESNGEYRTDETGSIYIPQLIGGFIVQEIKTKDGYILDNTAKTIYIEKGRVYSLEFFNQPENAFVIQKLDGETKAPLAGAVIKVTTVDGQFIGQYTTDESGMISISGLKPQTVLVQEVTPPEDYNLDNTVKMVHLKQNEPQKLELYNYKKAALIIYKVDKKTQEPLEGVKFKVTEIDGTYVGDYITGVDGKITIPSLEPNWYVVTETSPAEGYNIDETPSKNVQVKSGSPVTVKFENDKNATLRIVKTDKVTGKPMENVEFTIVRDDGKHYTNKLAEIWKIHHEGNDQPSVFPAE